MEREKIQLQMTITPPEFDPETVNPDDVINAPAKLEVTGNVPIEIALEIAKAIETIMKKHGKEEIIQKDSDSGEREAARTQEG